MYCFGEDTSQSITYLKFSMSKTNPTALHGNLLLGHISWSLLNSFLSYSSPYQLPILLPQRLLNFPPHLHSHNHHANWGQIILHQLHGDCPLTGSRPAVSVWSLSLPIHLINCCHINLPNRQLWPSSLPREQEKRKRKQTNNFKSPSYLMNSE